MIKVLIVEDDPMVAEFNRRYLSMVAGFELCGVASSADDALRLLSRQPIDLVLLDIFMPGLGGLELLVKIRSLGRNTDVIVVSAARDQQTINKALRYGAVDYLIKPFEFERLEKALLDYRSRMELLTGDLVLDQAELDRRILQKDRAVRTEMPKGLDPNTLRLVWEQIQQRSTWFTTEELARTVGFSRVSMRKYLEFLKSSGVLKLDISYGSVGRPVYRYLPAESAADLVKRYLSEPEH